MSIGSVITSLRSTPRGQFVVTFVLVAALTGLWGLATPLFVAVAVGGLSRIVSPRVALVGLAVALTPMVFSFGSAVNPSAPETAAAIATWACGLVIVSELRAGKEPDRGLVIPLGIAASALVLARQISMFWLAFIALILAALLG